MTVECSYTSLARESTDVMDNFSWKTGRKFRVELKEPNFMQHKFLDLRAYTSHIMGTVFFLGVKRPGHGVDQSPPLSSRLKKELNLYSPINVRGVF